jgi:transposase-like protein
VAGQRYQAVLAVISDGLSISQVASKVGVSRQTEHAWLARHGAEGLEGLVDRSHRPRRCVRIRCRRRWRRWCGAFSVSSLVEQLSGVAGPDRPAVQRLRQR